MAGNQGGIYMIRCGTTQKVYVGQSADMPGRWYYHKYQLRQGKHSNLHLQRSWKKYGENDFEFKVLQECTEADRSFWEGFYQRLLSATDRHLVFNVHQEDGSGSYKHSEGTKRKIGLAQLGRSPSQDVRSKMSSAKKGRPSSYPAGLEAGRGKKYAPEVYAQGWATRRALTQNGE